MISIRKRGGKHENARGRTLGAAARNLAKLLGHHSKTVGVHGGQVVGTSNDGPLMMGSLTRRDRYGTHVICECLWTKQD